MNIIEKLEALYQSLSSVSRTDTKEMADLFAIIEEYKKQEPVAWMDPDGEAYTYKTHEDSTPLFTHPPLSDETVKDAERYRWLCNNVSNSFILNKNDDHKTNYVTAKQWIEECAPEHFSDDDLNEIQKMKDTDTIWRLQVYPNTPIGFYVWHGATLSYAIDKAMKADK